MVSRRSGSVTGRAPPWLGVVPSVRLARPGDGEGLVVADGLVKLNGGFWEAVPATLVQFLDWAFTGRIVARRAAHGTARAGLDGSALSPGVRRVLRRAGAPGRRGQPRAGNGHRSRSTPPGTEPGSQAARAEKIARRTRTAGRRVLARADRAAPGGSAGYRPARPQVRHRPRPWAGASGTPGTPASRCLALTAGLPRSLTLIRGGSGGKQFALHAGTLLLFTSKDRQARFARVMKDYDPKPLGGWKTDHC